MGEMFGGMFALCVICSFIAYDKGVDMGKEQGRIDVAAGEWSCTQLPDERWECFTIKPEANKE